MSNVKRLSWQEAKVELKRRGHSYRSAAPLMGKSYQWLSRVLTGKEASAPVLMAIYKLPKRNAPRSARRWYAEAQNGN